MVTLYLEIVWHCDFLGSMCICDCIVYLIFHLYYQTLLLNNGCRGVSSGLSKGHSFGVIIIQLFSAVFRQKCKIWRKSESVEIAVLPDNNK